MHLCHRLKREAAPFRVNPVGRAIICAPHFLLGVRRRLALTVRQFVFRPFEGDEPVLTEALIDNAGGVIALLAHSVGRERPANRRRDYVFNGIAYA